MRGRLIALATVIVWGVTFVSTKVLLSVMTPLWILLIRFALGLLALCALRPRILHLKGRNHELLFLGAGASGIAAYYLLENIALVFTTATAVGVTVAAAPLFTAILAAFSGKRSALNARFFCGFALAFVGLALVGANTAGEEAFASGPDALLGDGLALAAALTWAVYSLLVERIADAGYETLAATKRIFFWGLIIIVPVTLLSGGVPPGLDVLLRADVMGNLLFLGLGASAACFVMWNEAVKRLGPAMSAAFIYLVPLITATASALILGESLAPPILCGIALTIAGLLLSQEQEHGDGGA